MAGVSKKKIKSKKGKEKIVYVITYRDIYGKQHTSGAYTTKAEARLHLHEFNGINPEIKEITFGELFKIYLEHAKAKYSHTTYYNYELYYKNHYSKLAQIKYAKVTSLDLEKFIADIEVQHSPYVAELCLKIGKSCINYAMKHKLVKENKFNSVSKINIPKKPKFHLSAAEGNHVLECCKELNPKYYLMFLTLLTTGMRIGEVVALNRDAIDFYNNKILINKQFTKGKLKYKPKTDWRVVYLLPKVKSLLMKHIDNLPKHTQIVFPNNAGNYYSADNVRERVWKPLLKYAGIENRVRQHDLRGSYIDIALNNGASIKFVQNQVGHSKSQTTLDVYAQNNQDMIDKAMEGLNDVFDIKE